MLDAWAAIATGLVQGVAWPAFGFLLLGIAAGAITGLLPGIGGPTMLALLLPLTLALSPVSAFALLMGAVSVTATAGDFSSILVGVPGEAVSAAVVIDGHAMAKRGEAGRAIGAALTSSLIGAIFGALALAFAIPLARPLMLSVGSPELFMLALLGITFLGPLAARAPLKGLIAGGLGFFLATVGLDPIDSQPRYTFDILFLWDGIGVLPVILGLFAIPEALMLASSGKRARLMPLTATGGIRSGVIATLRHWRLVLRCSAIGTYIGMLPGVGASVAQWVAYAHAKQQSHAAGQLGSIEGVLGPGAANNATLGGALIPTLVLGIPGSVQTAILLSALIIKGVIPGDTMLLPESQGGHLSFVFSLVSFIVIANIIVVAMSAWLVEPLTRVTLTRGSLLFPGVVVLTCIGAFAEKNAIEDLAVVAAAGALGWVMVQLDWPRPPLLLGLVIGPLAENRLFLSTSLYGWSWWQRPGVIVIGVIILAIAVTPFFRQKRLEPGQEEGADDAVAPSKSTADAAFVILIIAAATAALIWSRDFGTRAGLFPRLGLAIVLILSLIQLVITIRRGSTLTTHAPVAGAAPLWVAAFLLAIWTMGFTIGAPIMVLTYLRFGAREPWRIALAQGVVAFTFIELVLRQMLHIPFPAGLLGAALDLTL